MHTMDVTKTTNRPAKRVPARTLKLAGAALAGVLLSGCFTDSGIKEKTGTLLGAGGGALLGSQIGSGSGRLYGVAAGTLIGALLGNQIGKSLDRADRVALADAQQEAQTAPINETVHWRNPESGNSGSITPTREGVTDSGRYCREFQHTVFVGGKAEKGYGTACRQPDGSWQLLNG